MMSIAATEVGLKDRERYIDDFITICTLVGGLC